MKIKIYGCRGSIPFVRTPPSFFGGNTSCAVIESGGRYLIIDAGSGIMQFEYEMRETHMDYPKNLPFTVDILLSHLHLDHIIGLTMFAPIAEPQASTRIYTYSRNDTPLKEQIFFPFKPPYWPAPMALDAKAEIVQLFDGVTFKIGDTFTVTPFTAKHPDNSASFRITDGSRTVLHLLDDELPALDDDGFEKLVGYCKGADLIIFDAAYTPVDYPKKRGWGHSTAKDGERLAEACGCKKMIFSHFSPDYGDEVLAGVPRYLESSDGRFILARDGLEIEI
ncbi:MAG: MBL fold metallo-hydrolase [Defluviitaleaceae bacterium]|nr:MBL fold metallo-hydrolase [Defluviitaleaceae bacterium]